jgi:hypothetical protein
VLFISPACLVITLTTWSLVAFPITV